jgi:DNA-binding CsgD family transcriptional regulator
MNQPDAQPDPPAPSFGGAPVLPMSDMTAVIESLNRVLVMDGEPRDKITALLADLQKLLGYEVDTELLLYDQLDRQPGPRLIDRVWHGRTFDRHGARTAEEAQAAVDLLAPAWQAHLRSAMESDPPLYVGTFSSMLPDSSWFETVMRPQFLKPMGWTDVLTSVWVIDRQRVVSLAAFSRDDPPPFTPADEALLSVMARATAPLIDRELFGPPAMHAPAIMEQVNALTPRQQDVLQALLRGLSEKEVARELHRSQQTVHSHVKQIYRHFDVASRGELMAEFIDDRVRNRVA